MPTTAATTTRWNATQRGRNKNRGIPANGITGKVWYGPRMQPADVTPAWLSEVLDGEVRAITTDAIGDGLVGLNLRVGLVDADLGLPSSVVLKLPSLDPTSRATGIALRNYEREVKFYLQVADSVDVRVPHCHHGSWDEASGDFVLVLEDMAPAEQGNQLTGCSVEHAIAAVDELAKLHGPRWNDPDLNDIDWIGRRTGDDIGNLQGLWQMFLPSFLTTYEHHLNGQMLECLIAFGPLLGQWLTARDGPLTVTHGDYRLDNLLFGTTADGPPVTAVDWQTPGHGAPLADLSYFCGAGLVPERRREHERELVERYGEGLAAYGIDVTSDWLWEQYRRETFGGVVMAVIASQVVGVSDRSEALFSTMATRHLQHALDLDALSLI